MNRNLGIGILILCFGSSNINLAWAVEAMEIQPVIVQPYEIQELNQQMINRDRQNQDEEFAIKKLIEENNELTQTTLAQQQDEGLAKINQTMLSYRDALLSRDRARIMANGQSAWSSRYGDLIALTEDADSITVHQDLEDKSGLLAEKYQMLTELKDEMTALNEKLKNKGEDSTFNQKEAIIDGFKNIAQQQQDKIQMLTQRLAEMDKKIAQYDEIIAEKDHQIAQKNETIKDQESQIALLQGQPKVIYSPSTASAVAPLLAAKDEIIKEKQGQVDLLKSELQDKITQDNQGPKDETIKEKQGQVDLLKSELQDKITQDNQGPKDEIIEQQQKQIAVLKAQAQELLSKEETAQSQADQMATTSEQFKDNSAAYNDVKAQVLALRNLIHQQEFDLKAKNDSIRWLHQVLGAAKNKAEYYRLTSQINQIPMQQVQEEVRNIKDDFAQRLKDYDHFEKAVFSLKAQVDLLKSELENKIAEVKDQGRRDAQAQQDLKSQLQDKENQIVKMKADILAILQDQANKEIYRRKATAWVDDRIKLAKQLIDLQSQEAALLDEKSNLEADANTLFDQHFRAIENKIKGLLAAHQIQTVDLKSQMQELKNALDQKEDQVNSLETQLKNKIAEEKNQDVLADQIQDLKSQLQDKEDQITAMNTQIQSGQKTQDEADSLKQQLATVQDQADQLKQQLDSKTAQSDQMTVMMGDYQKKLESKDNAYNEQSGQIAVLNAQLHEKEAQVIKIRKDMYRLRESMGAKDRDTQAKDLSLSMVQQKVLDDKINEYRDNINELQATNVRQLQEITTLRTDLALARQELEGMPSSDEIDFLRAGLKKATSELKQKDGALLQIKANADEYVKEFKEQSLEFQNLKDQLLDARQEIQRKDEDLKYKDMAITRLKDLMGKPHENKTEAPLQKQLKNANLQVRELQAQLNQLKSSDTMEEKLAEAMDKIDEQGRMINILVQKLQDAGQSVDLTRDTGKQ